MPPTLATQARPAQPGAPPSGQRDIETGLGARTAPQTQTQTQTGQPRRASSTPTARRPSTTLSAGSRQSSTSRLAAQAQSRLPGTWLFALDPVALFALFILTALFIPSSSPTSFEDYLSASVRGFFSWQATLLDVVALSASRSAAAALFAAGVRANADARASLLPRLALYAWIDLSLGLGTAKLVKLVQAAPGEVRLPLPLGVVLAVVLASLAFGVAELAVLVGGLSDWITSLDYSPVGESRRVSVGHGGLAGAGGAGEAGDVAETPRRARVHWDKLGALLYPDWRIMIFGIVMLFLNSATNLVIPYYLGRVVDAVSSPKDPMSVLRNVMVELLVVFGVSGITGFARSLAFTLTGYRIVKRLRCAVFRAISIQDISFFDASNTGELVSRLSSDAQVLQQALTVNISMLLRFLTQAVGALVVLFSLSWKLTLIMFSCVPLVVIGSVIYGNYVSTVQEKFQDLLAAAQSIAQEAIAQIRTVRSFAKETFAQERYYNAIDETHKIGVHISTVQALFMGLTGFLPQIAIALVLYSGAVMVINGDITTGLLTSFILYTLTLAMAFGVLSGLFGDFMQAVGASQRIFELMDQVPDIPVTGGASIPNFRAKIALKNVEFSYPTRPDAPILKGVSLTLEPGTTLALVGPSGQGKSTIMSLLLRFYDAQAGSIILDDCYNLKVIDPSWYRSVIGYVSQEPVLFSGTIEENIMYGWQRKDRQPTTEEVILAAKQANAHMFIDEFPDKYNTAVGERGVQLSGGQKQRIAIARAFLLNPKILLLDEATSALDAESEHLVQEAIDRAMEGRTVVVIAHRLSTVMNATKIAVIEHGVVAEAGTHAELMSANARGVYRSLVMRQMQGKGGSNIASDLDIRASVTSLPPLEDAQTPMGAYAQTPSASDVALTAGDATPTAAAPAKKGSPSVDADAIEPSGTSGPSGTPGTPSTPGTPKSKKLSLRFKKSKK
ncbi:hypothetical protein BC831DRAFT_475453 [Entophlyctis helioformis]|nr:hypothetical protein BC831DRAFT_475453 [Entophlyctis helioformis]